MSLVDAAAALDRLIGRPLGGGSPCQLSSPHIRARNDFRSPNHKPAQYPQIPCPFTGPLPHLGQSPVYQKQFQTSEHHIPKCSTPLESLAPPLPLPPYAQQWGYPVEYPQDTHQTVSMVAGTAMLPQTRVSSPTIPPTATFSPSQVTDPAVFTVNDKLGSPLQQFQNSNQVFTTEVKGRGERVPPSLPPKTNSDEKRPRGLTVIEEKTQPCHTFQSHGHLKGRSEFLVRCNYAHGLGQLRAPSRHGKYKTRNCQSYHRTGFCRYGARCSFIHDPEEGVLRCSIANKEVLEALHYHPEDESRIANITWRLDDDPLLNQPATLHFIKSHTPLDENLDNSVFLKTRDTCTGNMLPLTWTQPIENKNDAVFSPPESIEPFKNVHSNFTSKNENYTRFPFPKNVISKEMQNNEDFVINSLRLLDELAAAHPVLESCQQHSNAVKIEELTDDPALPTFLDTMEESHSLQCLEVVNDILRNAPNYSSSFWSVAADEMNSLVTESQNKEVIDICDTNQNELLIFTNNEECFNKTALGNEVFEDANYALACSTLRSDYDEEPFDKKSSRKSSSDTNLADLIESLRVREEHQLARYPLSCNSQDSLVLSQDSPLSPDDSRLFDLTKYKTELCRSFQYNGFCKYGDACLYAHGGVDLRMYPKHPMYRTKKCFSFHNKGYCLYGSRCQFLHDVE
ncbi:unnamed protein product, partial [Meganyctiphanes norvegica]